jgi:hypothetical protein
MTGGSSECKGPGVRAQGHLKSSEEAYATRAERTKQDDEGG